MRFLIVMEVLNAMIRVVDSQGVFKQLGARSLPHRACLYADDLVMFVSPMASDLCLLSGILKLFESASGLSYNMAKCQLAPIRCSDDQVQTALHNFSGQLVGFPVTYLGIPLCVGKLPKSALHPLVDKMADRLPSWKGKLMHRSGRLVSVKTTLATMLVYTAISLDLPDWLHRAFEKVMKGFLWSGSSVVQPGKYLVAWSRVQCPLHLGVMDLRLLGGALRVHWLWLQRTDEARPWASLLVHEDAVTKAFFKASILCVLGDGATTLFWTDLCEKSSGPLFGLIMMSHCLGEG
jgi:hypothetical protein